MKRRSKIAKPNMRKGPMTQGMRAAGIPVSRQRMYMQARRRARALDRTNPRKMGGKRRMPGKYIHNPNGAAQISGIMARPIR